MELPNELKAALKSKIAGQEKSKILAAAENISRRYRERTKGSMLVETREEALAYAVARMPATFGAVYKSIEYTLEQMGEIGGEVSALDVGAGTGAGVWAVGQLLFLSSVTCLEYTRAMKELGQDLMQGSELEKAVWKSFDLLSSPIEERADFVIASYVINELPPEKQIAAAEKLWSAANRVLIITEPGTPEGYGVLKKIRTALTEKGAFVIAPCPNEQPCGLKEGDWCHFTCRVQRERLHRLAKGGDAPFEDEKFAYLALSKERAVNTDVLRVLRHPYTGKGYVKLDLCTGEGISQKTVTKSQKELYRAARKAQCGDAIILEKDEELK